jgi:hypothetical protein
MKPTTLILLLTCMFSLTFAQTEWAKTDTTKSVYRGLTTKKFYKVQYFSSSTNGVTTFKINNKEVSKTTYDKYYSTWKNMETCKPCILLTYDIDDKLLSKSVQYTDCPVGFWIEYFPNRKVKLIGHYKENVTGDWSHDWGSGNCRQDGAFTYFSETGKELYTEYWKEGQFIKQVPEQTKTELWNVELTHDGVIVDKQVFTPKQVSEIKITPQFKNSSTEGTNLTILVSVSAIGHRPSEQTFTIENFHTIDVQKMIDDMGAQSTEKISFQMSIYNNGVNAFNYWLTVQH